MAKKYLIDYEFYGTLVVDANNPQAAAAHAQAVLRMAFRILSEEAADDPDVRARPPVDLAEKCKVPA